MPHPIEPTPTTLADLLAGAVASEEVLEQQLLHAFTNASLEIGGTATRLSKFWEFQHSLRSHPRMPRETIDVFWIDLAGSYEEDAQGAWDIGPARLAASETIAQHRRHIAQCFSETWANRQRIVQLITNTHARSPTANVAPSSEEHPVISAYTATALTFPSAIIHTAEVQLRECDECLVAALIERTGVFPTEAELIVNGFPNADEHRHRRAAVE